MSDCRIVEQNTFITLKSNESLSLALRRSHTSPAVGSDSIAASPCTSFRSSCEFTTLMIKNIPCKYSQDWLLEDIRAVSEGVNFLQMPLTRRGDMCMGYAFVNFRTADQAREFLERFQGSAWARRPNSSKRAEVSVANEQGFDANVQKFVASAKKNSSRAQPFVEHF